MNDDKVPMYEYIALLVLIVLLVVAISYLLSNVAPF